ncbi:MAG: hypothetical protein K5694_06695 [Bacilli bacterium]|nr:hypothetical protein [Bacilli bacterium]
MKQLIAKIKIRPGFASNFSLFLGSLIIALALGDSMNMVEHATPLFVVYPTIVGFLFMASVFADHSAKGKVRWILTSISNGLMVLAVFILVIHRMHYYPLADNRQLDILRILGLILGVASAAIPLYFSLICFKRKTDWDPAELEDVAPAGAELALGGIFLFYASFAVYFSQVVTVLQTFAIIIASLYSVLSIFRLYIYFSKKKISGGLRNVIFVALFILGGLTIVYLIIGADQEGRVINWQSFLYILLLSIASIAYAVISLGVGYCKLPDKKQGRKEK